MNKTYGYVRVSTDEQTSNSQRDAIIARFPTASILADDGISGTVPPRERRPALGILLNQLLQEGDTLVIYAIDRIGRNARDTLELVEELEKRKITLVSIREGVDLSSAVGQAVLGVMASFAQMERKLILERQAAGIEAAKSRGQKFGRPTKIGAKEAGEIVMRRAMGVPIATIAKQLNLSRSAIYRHLEKVDAVAPE
nr:multiple promoter invertase [Escherichia coli]